MRPTLRPATEDDLAVLQPIAYHDFHHGRFLEDPTIPVEHARKRSFYWVADLLQQGHLQAAESRGKIIGFHAERLDMEKRHADLILTGTCAAYAMLALPLWTTALSNLSERGIQHCSTLISTANTGVINLYARLGFHFDTALLGFRKYL
ncbi:hypothetical protein CO615_05365 [Lysobacteraceae bacterium NML75-0749]|nr:hypothetical protein CO615_05365 [Xanthomonadaceae bacterium NML75-0749]PJK04892.1 hypothetical protein CO609_04385 [Xanthomonadaceae bacterium NML91-0268]PJK05243.1 hypothetical protein CO612_04165 [Xanthomonadaceae bacterium NML71-0210]